MPRDGKVGPKLTPKQQLFVEAYLGKAAGNGTEAARLAGYKGNAKTLGVVAAENLVKPSVAAAVGERIETAKDCMGADEVLAQLTDVAGASWREFCEVRASEDADGVPVFEVKMRLTDKLKALELLGKYHKLFVDRIEHSGEMAAKVYAGIEAEKV